MQRCSWPATAATDAAGSPAASASLVRVWGNARRPPSQGDGDDFVLLVVACLIGSCSRSTRCEEPVPSFVGYGGFRNYGYLTGGPYFRKLTYFGMVPIVLTTNSPE